MILTLIVLYIIIGASLGSVYYYLRLKQEDSRNADTFDATIVGIFWPVTAPFAFGFYFARAMREKEIRNDRRKY